MAERFAQRRPVARWLIVGLLAVIAACLLVEAGSTASTTSSELSAGGKGSVFAVAGQITPDTYGLYLVDLENGTICVYQYLGGARRLRLMAARTFAYDRQLDEYNTEPLPREIRELVEQQRRLERAPTRPTSGQ